MNWWDIIVVLMATTYAIGSFFGIIWILRWAGIITYEWKDTT